MEGLQRGDQGDEVGVALDEFVNRCGGEFLLELGQQQVLNNPCSLRHRDFSGRLQDAVYAAVIARL